MKRHEFISAYAIREQFEVLNEILAKKEINLTIHLSQAEKDRLY
jgi:CRISPR/Cas system-associated endonuclease Cas3-HD